MPMSSYRRTAIPARMAWYSDLCHSYAAQEVVDDALQADARLRSLP